MACTGAASIAIGDAADFESDCVGAPAVGKGQQRVVPVYRRGEDGESRSSVDEIADRQRFTGGEIDDPRLQ